MKRRTLLGGGTIALFSTAGCVGFLRNQLGGESDDTDGSSDQQDTTDTSETNQPAEANASPDEDERNTSENTTENEPEYAEAQDPVPEPEVDTNESAINESAEDTTPTEDDVTLSNTELVTETDTATVMGTVTHSADGPLTIDLEVQFLNGSEKIGRPALGGTTGLAPGDEWNFEIVARGSGAGEATDYDITIHVSGQ